MDKSELYKAIDKFYKRIELLDHAKHSVYISRQYDSLNTFKSDGNYLKDFDIEIDDSFKSFTFQRANFQYLNLSKQELFAYIASRTSFRNGKLPNISRIDFIAYIYIFEIVNGIHGDGYTIKRDLLDSLCKLFNTNESKYQKVFAEGYELLFLQYYYNLDKEEYFKSVPFELFNGYKLKFDSKLPVRFMTTDEIFFLVNEHIFKKKINKNYNTNDKCIFDELFDYVKETVDKKIISNNLSITTLSSTIKYALEFELDIPFKNMIVAFPEQANVQFIDNKNKMHLIDYGIHSTMKYKTMVSRADSIYGLFVVIMDSLNLVISKKGTEKYNYNLSENSNKLLKLIKSAVSDWVSGHPFAIGYNEISTDELEAKIQMYNENPDTAKELEVDNDELSGSITINSYDSGISLIDKYIERAISKTQVNWRYLKFDKFYNKSINPNDKSFDIFLSDAIKLKDVNCSIIFKTPVNHFTKDLIQYFLLSVGSLLGYFGFRTQLRNNIVPSINKYSDYLMLYLTEIVNGVHGDSYDNKRFLLDNLMFLTFEKNTYNELLTESYEILYLQYENELDFKSYQESISLLLFDNYIFTKKKVDNTYPISMEHVFKEVGNSIDIHDFRDKYLLKACFDFVINKIIDTDFRIDGVNLVDLLKFNTLKLNEYQYKKIKARFPSAYNIYFIDDLKVFHSIEGGIHSRDHYYYDAKQKRKISDFLVKVLYSLYRYCGVLEETTNYYDTFWDHHVRSDFPEKYQHIIDVAVLKWVSTDNKVLSTILDSPNDKAIKKWLNNNRKLKESKDLSYDKSYQLDISDIDDVRKASYIIQEKLIIEEEIDDLSLEKAKNIEDEVENDGTLDYVVKNIEPFERNILNLLMNSKNDTAIELARNEGISLELIVDKINELSMQCIEDVLIINNEVVDDYLPDLELALK